MNFDESSEFAKDVKSFRKKVPTLESDIKRARSKLESLYIQPEGLDDSQWVDYKKNFFDNKRATKLKGYSPDYEVIKLRIDTDTRQYKDKLRLVCVVVIENTGARLVEVYSKSDKSREDRRRLKDYL